MSLRSLTLFTCGFLLAACSVAAEPTDPPPELVFEQSGLQLTLVAEHPDVVTPTGIDVDEQGDIWVVASHTHFRPDDYEGPPHDEVLVIAPDDKRRVFYDKTDATMDLELGDDGWVYLAERDRILRVRDTDGDGVGDDEQTLCMLETAGDYPHNGLAGLAWHPEGDLVFSLGENHWEQWTLRGADDAVATGTGEGGVFRCTADGRGLRRIAKGFWNPFGICVREDGTIFAAENDPGARPPCRLLHVVEGGDYGYQRLYGSAPFHPFVCWNGELRGTLPMVRPIGEAPCGIVPLGGGLVVTSWTDNRIDFYPLEPQGASFAAERIALVRGGHEFRPTCITRVAPTIFYLTDWVAGSYQLHGQGRVWKLEIDVDEADWFQQREIAAATDAARLAERLRSGGHGKSDDDLLRLARSGDPFIARAALDALSQRVARYAVDEVHLLETPDRLSLLLAIRKADPQNRAWIHHFLNDEDAEVRFEALRWIADERLAQFRPEVEKRLRSSGADYRLFEACLATWNTLSGNPRAGVADPQMLIQRVQDEEATPVSRAFALRLLDPAHRELKGALMDRLIALDDSQLLQEVVRTSAARGTDEARDRLREIALDEEQPVELRADAVAGLANPRESDVTLLLKLTADERQQVREEALRSLRFAKLGKVQRQQLMTLIDRFPQSRDLVVAALRPAEIPAGRPDPAEVDAWQQRLAAVTQPVDREAGRRIFYHSSVGTCSKCHRRDGRGNVVGPDLSAVSSGSHGGGLLTSLLQPSRDVAPQYYPWALVTDDGQTFVGIPLRDGGGGSEVYRDNRGRERVFKTAEIVAQRELETSMMPDGLCDTMTDREIRDLLAYLAADAGR